MSPVVIALDVMSGDLGPIEAVAAALGALQRLSHLRILLVGQGSAVEQAMQHCLQSASFASASASIDIVSAASVVTMDDSPTAAYRYKRDSSMWRSLQLLREGEAHAVVSAGNTGALMMMAVAQLGLIDGLRRPAICACIPLQQELSARSVYLLDAGANVDSSTERLHQFAHMGSALATVLDQLPSPRIATLNIGVESGKGNAQVRALNACLQRDNDLQFVGSVEANTLLDYKADVVVCDGFAGNIALKAYEGMAEHARRLLDLSTQAHADDLSSHAKANLTASLSAAAQNGAYFLGLKQLLVKSHGHADRFAIESAIEKAAEAARSNLISTINQRVMPFINKL